MNNLRNRVQLIGNLGSDPEGKELEKGRKMARFSMATNESYKNQEGELVKETQWHQIVAWGKTAEVILKYMKQGQEVCLMGKISNRKYDDGEGNVRYFSEVVAQEIMMLGSKKT